MYLAKIDHNNNVNYVIQSSFLCLYSKKNKFVKLWMNFHMIPISNLVCVDYAYKIIFVQVKHMAS